MFAFTFQALARPAETFISGSWLANQEISAFPADNIGIVLFMLFVSILAAHRL